MSFKKGLRHFWRDETATASLEFVIVFPIVMILFTAAFESAMILTRQVMLERALDATVRVMRITPNLTATHDQIASIICRQTVVINDCDELLTLDLRVVAQPNYELPNQDALCVNRAGSVRPANSFDPGLPNQLMLIRACVVVDRILPLSGFGLNLTRDDTGGLHMIAASIFVNEP